MCYLMNTRTYTRAQREREIDGKEGTAVGTEREWDGSENWGGNEIEEEHGRGLE